MLLDFLKAVGNSSLNSPSFKTGKIKTLRGWRFQDFPWRLRVQEPSSAKSLNPSLSSLLDANRAGRNRGACTSRRSCACYRCFCGTGSRRLCFRSHKGRPTPIISIFWLPDGSKLCFSMKKPTNLYNQNFKNPKNPKIKKPKTSVKTPMPAS
jgi:hypothetical protein